MMTGLLELTLVGACPLLGPQLAERIQAAGINVQVRISIDSETIHTIIHTIYNHSYYVINSVNICLHVVRWGASSCQKLSNLLFLR
jgi:histidinol phosphatase-like enzyme